MKIQRMNEPPENSSDDYVPRRRSRRRRFLRRERSEAAREAQRLRIRRRGRRAYIRSVYSLPSLATLGNAICGFGAMYVAALDPGSNDHLTSWFYSYRFLAAGYLIFIAMLFDAIDGRLARFARHTTDFGGQLDSLADVISFGCAPAFVALELFHSANLHLPSLVGRLMWSIGALYMSCAAIRLARFNVSNEHGEQYHFSFLGLPSPGAGAAVAGLILMQQDMNEHAIAHHWTFAANLAILGAWALPVVLLVCGLLMVSTIRFPHVVNRYLRGRRSIPRLLTMLIVLLLMVTLNRYTLGIGSLGYVIVGLAGSSVMRFRPRGVK
ncbi:MAG TPA: CDP-alcohol phosphatidyltransferase family protein [Tepidisphaeraceae bacterium]|jgi:CDP-diacylglycerol--serine O-phosphatidyltransferase|nr:CDP-alcohol phosphatidyltransferase family protein [Tepidisphaeraceae bacterium]